MITKPIFSMKRKEEEIPKSITNVIPLKVELTSIAIITGCIAVPYLGVFWGLGTVGYVTTLVKSYFYDAKVEPLVKNNYEIRSEREEKRRNELFQAQIISTKEFTKASKKQDKAYSIVIGGILAGLCYKIVSLITPIFCTQCCTTEERSSLYCLGLFEVKLFSIIGGLASCGYILKKTFE